VQVTVDRVIFVEYGAFRVKFQLACVEIAAELLWVELVVNFLEIGGWS
jgi:hypothetical protein